MTEPASRASGSTNEVDSNSERTGAFVFSAVSTPHGPGGLPLRTILPPKSALKGHQRSASHGGIVTRGMASGELHFRR